MKLVDGKTVGDKTHLSTLFLTVAVTYNVLSFVAITDSEFN